MGKLADKEFTWRDKDLIFRGEVICSLVPHQVVPNHWHLKFQWRHDKTPEFFNIFNARENARLYSRWHAQQTPVEAPPVSLN